MQKIVGKKILLTRGDTFKATVTMKKKDGTIYEPTEGDVVRFALKQCYCEPNPLIVKVIPNDTLLLHLEPSDTKTLDFGSYKYDIEITFANGDVDTFIDRADFELLEEVH